MGLLALVLFDPLHNWLGLGYYQLGHHDPEYYYTNFIFFCLYLCFIAIVGYFKKNMEEYEVRNEQLIKSQRERNFLIEEQKEELESKSFLLNQLLQEKDKDLSQVAQELLRFNHELLQYSYALSHNLRGPVASIMGLLNLLNMDQSEEEKNKILPLLNESSQSLDAIIHDLNKIVEARKDTFHIRENVVLEEVLEEVLRLLHTPVETYNVRIISDFSKAPDLFSSKERVHHILFSLLTNAIQYRRPEARVEIRVNSFRKDGFVVLEVEDNGQGIDLEKHSEDIFKPFKRFHLHASGKGMGLYLVKLQVKKLYGKIEVKSFPATGSIFSVYLKDLKK